MQSSLNQAVTGARRRRWPALAAALLLVAGIAAACGGDDDKATNPPPRTTPVTTVATFTPVPPEALATRTAEAEAAAQTATAQPPPASPVVDPGTPEQSASSEECELEHREGEISPPDLFLSAGGSRQCGMIASFNWYVPVPVDRGARVEPQQGSQIPNSNITVPAGESMSIIALDEPIYPYESATIGFYTFENNIAIPTDTTGQIKGNNYVFVPQTEASWSQTIQGPLLSFTPQVPPGRYIVTARVDFVGDAAIEAQAGAFFAAYTFVVTVQ